jgi:hypothetical protein
MAEPEAEAAWRAEFERSGAAQLRDVLNSGAGFTNELKRQAAFGSVMKPKRNGSSRSKPTTMSGGPSWLLSLL